MNEHQTAANGGATNMLEEYAVLVQCLRTINGCRAYREVASALLALLVQLKLDGVVQLRLPDLELTLSAMGENSAVEVSMIRHVREMERIVAFRDKAAFNYERITILVNNMPLADAELCGRLRDHLAIVAAAADDRLAMLYTMIGYADGIAALANVVSALDRTRSQYVERVAKARAGGAAATESLVEQFSDMSGEMDMSAGQEAEMISAIQRTGERIADDFDLSPELAPALDRLAADIDTILQRDIAKEQPAKGTLPPIELF